MAVYFLISFLLYINKMRDMLDLIAIWLHLACTFSALSLSDEVHSFITQWNTSAQYKLCPSVTAISPHGTPSGYLADTSDCISLPAACSRAMDVSPSDRRSRCDVLLTTTSVWNQLKAIWTVYKIYLRWTFMTKTKKPQKLFTCLWYITNWYLGSQVGTTIDKQYKTSTFTFPHHHQHPPSWIP